MAEKSGNYASFLYKNDLFSILPQYIKFYQNYLKKQFYHMKQNGKVQTTSVVR